MQRTAPLNLNKAKYWYKFYHTECPVCGRLDDWKERQYETEKPTDRGERHIYKQQYDNCMEW